MKEVYEKWSENQRFSVGEHATDRSIDRRRHGNGVIYEGEGGLYSQTWWPLCRSTDVEPGRVIGREFLDGKVAIFRDSNGAASVMSGYCPHNGADLSIGQVCGELLQCRFHRWEFDANGKCLRTGSGDKVPPRARIFKYSTATG